ncbi:M56 family metallopeptidase [Pedobacter nototheniae]|uniref:M56 family metallopeptidase n=1 Tax=Pedobacter nototheniae TaxID=2488994 RepID=UPI002931E7BB|nr:M56 family metallopeptidase [Pedobacter nototheniae]
MIYYLVTVALILTTCLVFYKALLQKETFFPLNRIILLSCLVLAFCLPLIPIPQQWSLRKTDSAFPVYVNIGQPNPVKPSVVKEVPGKATPDTGNVEVVKESKSIFKDFSIFKALTWIYWLGVMVFSINFLFQLSILLYRSYSRPFIQDGRYRIVELAGDQAPCSFGNNIFINPEKYDWDTYNQIILHEKIHIKQGHSYDILLAELALVFQWFNPFAWLYRKAIEDNLEFLTDNELLQHSDVERTSYQMSLVKVSAPHFPISLTTNYNQSILKKRLVMMNAKKSNISSTWKYLFIVPVLLVFVSFFNEPIAYGKTNKQPTYKTKELETEGSWFATVKGDKLHIRFESGINGKENNSSTTFSLAEFKNLPKNERGSFSLSRDAGTIVFSGKFDGNTGMGDYKFNADQSFIAFLDREGIKIDGDRDAMVFYMVNVNKSFVNMLKAEGYTKISKNDLIPLAALGVDLTYISSLKKEGLNNVSLQDLIPLKALGVDGKYVAEIKKTGYKNITADKLITFKSQGITGDFIKNAKIAKTESKEIEAEKVNENNKSPKKVQTSNQDDDDEAFGDLIAKKALNITAEYVKGFTDKGIKVTDDELISMKSLGITPEFISGFKNSGFPNLTNDEAISLKSLGVTVSEFAAYKKLDLNNLTVNDVISAKATGTSPSFIMSMKKKGFNYHSIDKYVQLRVVAGVID